MAKEREFAACVPNHRPISIRAMMILGLAGVGFMIVGRRSQM